MKNIPTGWLLMFAVIIFACFYAFGHTVFVSPQTAKTLYIIGGVISTGLILYAIIRTYLHTRKD